MGWTDPPNLFDESSDAAAFGHGVFDGLRPEREPRPDAYESSRRDPYYYKAAYVIGYVIKVCLLVVSVAVLGHAVPF